jgi:hypothetical protein
MSRHYDVILHQVRAPLDVIASLQTLQAGSFNYIDNKIGINQYDDRILQATRYWIEWNMAAAQMSEYSYRVEDMPEQLPVICDYIGIPYAAENVKIVISQNNTNSRRHENVDAAYIRKHDALLYEQLRHTADFLGYKV